MPQDIIDQLSQYDRSRMFIEFINRKPTEAGWTIVSATVKELGEDFLIYVFDNTVEALKSDNELITKEVIVDLVESLFTGFATDLNTFQEYVSNYLEERGDTVQEKKDLPKRDSKGRFIKSK